MSGFPDFEHSQHGQAGQREVAYEIKNLVANAFIGEAKAFHVEHFTFVEYNGVGKRAALD